MKRCLDLGIATRKEKSGVFQTFFDQSVRILKILGLRSPEALEETDCCVPVLPSQAMALWRLRNLTRSASKTPIPARYSIGSSCQPLTTIR